MDDFSDPLGENFRADFVARKAPSLADGIEHVEVFAGHHESPLNIVSGHVDPDQVKVRAMLEACARAIGDGAKLMVRRAAP